MRVLVVAVGNVLRGDDGVAHAVLGLAHADALALAQLTPEVAEQIALYATVIFVDADAGAADLRIETVEELSSAPSFSHASTPAEIVALSRSLFGFRGRALLCRIPAHDFSAGEGLSPRTRALAARAKAELDALLGGVT